MGGQLWKIGYIFAARMSTMFLGMIFVFARGILYADVYGRGPREGIAAHADQQTAGGLMMTLDIVMMVVAVLVLLARLARARRVGRPPHLGGASAARARAAI